MRVGLLDQQIQLVSFSTENVGGELTETYTPGDKVFAQVISQKGNEAFEAARTNARSTIRVCIHYRDDVVNTWQLIWLHGTYNIVDTDRSQRRDGYLWITAQAVGAM